MVADGVIVSKEDRTIACVKVAVDLVWNLPALALRLKMDETEMRKALSESTQNPKARRTAAGNGEAGAAGAFAALAQQRLILACCFVYPFLCAGGGPRVQGVPAACRRSYRVLHRSQCASIGGTLLQR